MVLLSVRLKKISHDYKIGAEEVKRRLEEVLKQQRVTVRGQVTSSARHCLQGIACDASGFLMLLL